MISVRTLALTLCVSLCFAVKAHAAEFEPCTDVNDFAALRGTLCRVFETPLGAPGPLTGGAAPTIALFVRKIPALGHARGTLWLVSGGPGESGSTFYPFLGTLRAAFPDFDLLIPDHRGTGNSTRLCPKEEALSSPGGRALAGAEWGTCWQVLNAAPDYARAFSITNAAQDLAAMMAQYQGAEPTYLYGVSYGTQLVLRTFQVARPKVRGVLLDSLVPPEATTQWDLSHRSQVADAVGRKVLGADTDAYAALIASPKPGITEQVPGKDLKRFFGGLLDFPSARARIPELVAELARGETATLAVVKTHLEHVGATFDQYPQSPPSIPLVSIISVSENDARPKMTKQDVATEEEGLLFATALPGLLVDPGLPLYARDRFFNAAPATLPRTLVLQGTLDPKTPFEGAVAQVANLPDKVTLIPVIDAPHFVLMTSPACFTQAARIFFAGGRIDAPACANPQLREGF